MAGAAPSLSKRTYAVSEKKRSLARGFSTVFGKGLHDDSILDKFRPVTIVVILSFETPTDAQALRKLLLDRLVCRWDRFRSRMSVQGGHVVFDELAPEELDMDYHVIVEDSDGWDRADWDKFLCRIYGTYKEVDRPLWRWHVCNNLKSGQSRIVWNIDHCVCDGVSLAYCLNQLFDPDPDAPHMPAAVLNKGEMRQGPPVKPPKPYAWERAWWALSGISEGFLSVVYPGDPPSSMKVKDIQNPSKEKRFSNARTLPLSKVQDIKTKFGVTVNDVLGGLLNMTIQRSLQESEPDKMSGGRSVRINFPINMRSPSEMRKPEIRNVISTGMIKVALNHKSTYEAMMAHNWMLQRIKASPAPLIQMHVLNVAARLLPYEFLVAVAFILYGKFTLMMSNVPGPPKRRPLNGNVCTDVHFYLFVPIGIYCGLISYDGKISFTVNADSETATRPDIITKIWAEEFDKLYDEVMAPEFKPTWRPPRPSAITQAIAAVAALGAGAGIAYLVLRRR